MAGNATRIVFERFGYPVSGCLPDGYTFTPSTSEPPTAQFYPADRTLVTIEVPSLLSKAVALPIPTSTSTTVSDGHWAVTVTDEVVWRDLDMGSEKLLNAGSYLYAPPCVAKPYVLLHDITGGAPYGSTLLNAETGESQRLPGVGAQSGVSAHWLAYAEDVRTPYSTFRYLLKVMNLDTGAVALVKDATAVEIRLVRVLDARVVWVEVDYEEMADTVQVYELASRTVSPLVTVGWHYNDAENHDNSQILDLSEAGALVRREHIHTPSAADVVTYELVSYEASSTIIDSRGQESGCEPRPALAGPYVLYPQDGAWIIYDPVDGSTQRTEPFAPQ